MYVSNDQRIWYRLVGKLNHLLDYRIMCTISMLSIIGICIMLLISAAAVCWILNKLYCVVVFIWWVMEFAFFYISFYSMITQKNISWNIMIYLIISNTRIGYLNYYRFTRNLNYSIAILMEYFFASHKYTTFSLNFMHIFLPWNMKRLSIQITVKSDKNSHQLKRFAHVQHTQKLQSGRTFYFMLELLCICRSYDNVNPRKKNVFIVGQRSAQLQILLFL